jgi:hypothetical protein
MYVVPILNHNFKDEARQDIHLLERKQHMFINYICIELHACLQNVHKHHSKYQSQLLHSVLSRFNTILPPNLHLYHLF